MSTLPYALAAAARGWHVFPLRPRCKTPLGGFADWEANATRDPSRIAAFWSRGSFNVAIACGPSRLVVVDLDTPKPGEQQPEQWALPGVNEGADVLALLCERHGQPFPHGTFTVRTRRGGTHLYFTAPPGVELRNTSGRHRGGLGWLIDTRAEGGYVVGPGSYVDLPDGAGAYEVIDPAPVAPLPDWLTGLLKPAPAPTPAWSAPSLSGEVADLDAYLQAALHAEVERVATAQPGGRNHALNKAAYNLGRLTGSGALPEHLAREALSQAASVHYSPGRSGLSLREANATITSGLSAGARRPRTITRKDAV